MSCNPNISEPLVWKYENDRVEVKIEGSQENWAEPWQTIISLYVDDEIVTSQPGLPVFNSELSKETVKVIWYNNNRSKVIFTQSDGSKKEVFLPNVGVLLK